MDYDAVVLGSRVELGRHAPELLAYVRAHRDALRATPTAFFSVSMAAANASAGADPEHYMQTTFDALAWHPTMSVAFGGALPYRN
jgi:menaquinone-dependent protoporphyrinogen oxidase